MLSVLSKDEPLYNVEVSIAVTVALMITNERARRKTC